MAMGRFLNPADAYDAGLLGAYTDPREDELCADSIIRHGGNPDGSSVAHEWDFADAGKGKLVPMWEHVTRTWPGCWPGPAQENGSCVSFGLQRACLMSWTCELIDGRPDEVTGVIEGKPDLSAEAIANSVLSNEVPYWYRGHNGADGWTCSGAARAVTTECGIWLRQDYPEFKLDLTTYSGDTEIKYGGSRRPPQPITDYGQTHLVRTATFLKTIDEIRDFLFAGYGVFFCSSLKWSNKRDDNGYSPVVPGTWMHSQALCGFDDRPETIRLYGEPLAAVLNSWGKRWNSGSRKVRGTDLEIPEGAYWSKASVLLRGQCIALSSVAGWPPRKLKSYGAVGNV
jgi:hypothetical protein